MKYFASKRNCIKNISVAELLLRDSLRTNSLRDKAEKIMTALVNIEMVLKAKPEIDFPYRDVLTTELSHLRAREVTYIDGFTGKTAVMPFSKIEEESQMISYNDAKRKKAKLPKTYDVGNFAIGQIFVKGKEAFSVKVAISHSLESLVIYWLSNCTKLANLLEGVN